MASIIAKTIKGPSTAVGEGIVTHDTGRRPLFDSIYSPMYQVLQCLRKD